MLWKEMRRNFMSCHKNLQHFHFSDTFSSTEFLFFPVFSVLIIGKNYSSCMYILLQIKSFLIKLHQFTYHFSFIQFTHYVCVLNGLFKFLYIKKLINYSTNDEKRFSHNLFINRTTKKRFFFLLIKY